MTGYRFPDEQESIEVELPDTAAAPADEQQVQAEANDVELDVVDDTPERDRGRKPLERAVEDPSDDELQNYSEGVKKRIKELTHARHDERRAKEALMRERAELERVTKAMMEENRRLKQYVSTGEQEYVKVATSAAEASVDAAKRRYKEAYDAGDADALLEAQTQLNEAQFRLNQAKNYRAAPVQEQEIAVQPERTVPEAPQIDDKTLRWQARNQWWGAPGNEDMTSFSLGLHHKLVNSGVDPRSDEYFEQIDARLRKAFPDYFGGETQPTSNPTQPARKPATVVAPAARSTGVKRVQLTKTQLDLAAKFGLTPQQYAAELVKMEKSNG